MAQEPKNVPGGWTDPPRDAGPKEQALVDQVKGAVEAKVNKTFETFKAKLYSTQVVNGINYKIKILVDGSDVYIHIMIYVGFGDPPKVELISVEVGKTEKDPIV